jgi:type VI secretion system protein ImpB
MAKKESSVAPKERINVTFKPATGGAVEEIELPMKVMVMGDFLQRHDPRSLLDRKPVSINKNNFTDVMTNQRLTLEIVVPNVLQDGEPDTRAADTTNT